MSHPRLGVGSADLPHPQYNGFSGSETHTPHLSGRRRRARLRSRKPAAAEPEARADAAQTPPPAFTGGGTCTTTVSLGNFMFRRVGNKCLETRLSQTQPQNVGGTEEALRKQWRSVTPRSLTAPSSWENSREQRIQLVPLNTWDREARM